MFSGFVFLAYFLGAMLINYLIVRTWGSKTIHSEYPDLEDNSIKNWICLTTILTVTYGTVFYAIWVVSHLI